MFIKLLAGPVLLFERRGASFILRTLTAINWCGVVCLEEQWAFASVFEKVCFYFFWGLFDQISTGGPKRLT